MSRPRVKKPKLPDMDPGDILVTTHIDNTVSHRWRVTRVSKLKVELVGDHHAYPQTFYKSYLALAWHTGIWRFATKLECAA